MIDEKFRNKIKIMEDLRDLIDFVIPNESLKFPNLHELKLESKFLPALLPNPQNASLFYRKISHKSRQPTHTVCLVHGFGEHSGRYMSTAAFLALRGAEVHTLDLRLSGYSTGIRAGHDLYELQQDINVLLSQSRPDLPCFILGHSMGGLLVSTLLMNNPELKIAGVIITAALYKNNRVDLSFAKFKVAELMMPVLRDLVLNAGVSLGSLSRDTVYLKQVVEDNKLVPFLGGKMAISMMKLMKGIINEAPNFVHPVVFYHGTADPLTCPTGTTEFYQRCGSSDKTLNMVEGAMHELQHEIERDEHLQSIADWITQRIPGAPTIGKLSTLRIGNPALRDPYRNAKFWSYVLIVVATGLKFRGDISTCAEKFIQFTKL